MTDFQTRRALPGLAVLAALPYLAAQAPDRPNAPSPVVFEQNTGRWDDCVRFVSRGAQHVLFLTDDEAVWSLRSRDGSAPVVRTRLGAGPSRVRAQDVLAATGSYFVGNDPAAWRTGIPLARSVRCERAWPGIDVVWHARDGALEYDFVVAPSVDPSAIRFSFAGADATVVDERGDLVLRTAAGELRHRRPFTFQELDGARVAIESAWRVDPDGQCSFALGTFDPTRELVIDPKLAWSTFVGVSSAEQDTRMTGDAGGAAVVTGITASANFPTVNARRATAAPRTRSSRRSRPTARRSCGRPGSAAVRPRTTSATRCSGLMAALRSPASHSPRAIRPRRTRSSGCSAPAPLRRT
jgi:hypothetical protein